MRWLALLLGLLLSANVYAQTPGGSAVTQTQPSPFAGGTFTGPIATNSGTPTIASGACGTTNNGTVAGDNQSGKVTIGAAATATCAVTFSLTFATAPKAVVLTPANAAAAALAAGAPFVSAVTTGGFTFQAAALASTTWYFHAY